MAMAMAMATATVKKPRRRSSRVFQFAKYRLGLVPLVSAWVTSARLSVIVVWAVTWVASKDVLSADWKITPRVTLKETYTDNVRLSGRGTEESDFISEVEPGVSITGRGARLQLQADYAFKYRAYSSNGSANGHNQSLRSNALLDVWDKKLFLQASASVLQQEISTLGTISNSDVNISANRTEVRNSFVSPYWKSRLGNWGSLDARFSWTRQDADGEARALSTETQGMSVGISSGPAFSNFGWSLVYSDQTVESTGGRFARREIESLTGSARYRFLPTMTGILTIGRDENSYGSVRGSTGGDFYSLGLEWAPSTRTKVSASAGERYFGNSYAFNFEHRTRLSTWRIGYTEQIVATANSVTLPVSIDTASLINDLLINQIPDPVVRQQAVQAVITQNGLPSSLASSVDFLTNQVSLSKRLQGSMGLRGARGSVLLSIFRDNRIRQTDETSILSTDPFSSTDNVVQTGYSGILSWRLTERTSGLVSVGQTLSKLAGTGREDTNSTIRVGLTHQLQPKVRGAVEYRWLDRDSTTAAQVRENAISGTLTIVF